MLMMLIPAHHTHIVIGITISYIIYINILSQYMDLDYIPTIFVYLMIMTCAQGIPNTSSYMIPVLFLVVPVHKCKIVDWDTIHFISFHFLFQWGACADTSSAETRGEVAGHAGELGEVDDQTLQESKRKMPERNTTITTVTGVAVFVWQQILNGQQQGKIRSELSLVFSPLVPGRRPRPKGI